MLVPLSVRRAWAKDVCVCFVEVTGCVVVKRGVLGLKENTPSNTLR